MQKLADHDLKAIRQQALDMVSGLLFNLKHNKTPLKDYRRITSSCMDGQVEFGFYLRKLDKEGEDITYKKTKG